MAQETNVISKDRTASSKRSSAPIFIREQTRRADRSNPYSDMKELVKIAYKNGVAALEWKEAGLVLIAERDEDGTVVVRKNKRT